MQALILAATLLLGQTYGGTYQRVQGNLPLNANTSNFATNAQNVVAGGNVTTNAVNANTVAAGQGNVVLSQDANGSAALSLNGNVMLWCSYTQCIVIPSVSKLSAPAFITSTTGSATAPAVQINSGGTGVLGWYSAGNVNQSYQALSLTQNGARILTLDMLGGSLQFNALGAANTGYQFYANGGQLAVLNTGTSGGLRIAQGGLAVTPNNNVGVPSAGIIIWQGAASHSETAVLNATTQITGTRSGASVTLAGAIPAGSVVVGVSVRVTTAITGATSFSIGDGTTATAFGSAIAIASGTTTTNANWTISSAPVYAAGANIVLTANGSNFTGGVVRVTVSYISCTAPLN